jgi:hypothetical protein
MAYGVGVPPIDLVRHSSFVICHSSFVIGLSSFAMLTPVRSVSQRAAAVLRPGVTGTVLASFEHACDLVTDAGALVALVWGGIGNGPLNLVLEAGLDPVPEPGATFVVVPASSGQRQLRIGGRSLVDVTVSPAVTWDPRPDWQSLKTRNLQIVAGARMIAGILAEAGWTAAHCGLPGALCERAASGEREALRSLVGLGPGLTPAGDDWLAGWLLAQYLTEDLTGLRNLSGLVMGRTTTLSRALLACAAAGEADESWHALLSALAADPMADLPIYQSTSLPIYQSTQTVLSHGATSGAAMLLGFCAGVGRSVPDS